MRHVQSTAKEIASPPSDGLIGIHSKVGERRVDTSDSRIRLHAWDESNCQLRSTRALRVMQHRQKRPKHDYYHGAQAGPPNRISPEHLACIGISYCVVYVSASIGGIDGRAD